MPLVFNSCKKKEDYPIRVIGLVGEAKIQKADRTMPLYYEDPVEIGDIIKTGSNSHVVLTISRWSVIKIYEKSSVRLTRAELTQKDELIKSSVGLTEGKIFVILKKLFRGGTFDVTTQTIVCSVRGTSFAIDSTAEKNVVKSTLKVVEGAVKIEDRVGKNVKEEIAGGERITVESEGRAGKKEKIAKAEMEVLVKEKEEVAVKLEPASSVKQPEEKKKEDAAPVKKEPQAKNEQKIDQPSQPSMEKAPVLKTETQIKEYYHKLEEVTLDDGSKLIGAIFSQDNQNVRMNTTSGVVTIPIASIVKVVMK